MRIRDTIFWNRKKPRLLIIGEAKSGTTAAANLLGLSTHMSVKSDISALWHPTNEQIWTGERSFRDVYQTIKNEFRFNIIKEPNLTFMFSEVQSVFPTLPVLFVIRSPYYTLRSQLSRMELPGNLENLTKNELERVEPNWRVIFRSPFIDRPSSHYISILAQRWCFAAEIYLKNRRQFYIFKYEDFLKNKAKYIEEQVKELGFQKKRNIESLVDVPFQPKGASTPIHAFFGERNCHLIKEACSKTLQRLGDPFKDYGRYV